MVGTVLVGYLFCLVAAVAAVWLLTHGRGDRHEPAVPAVTALLAAARRRAVTAVAVCAVVVLALAAISAALPGLVGLPLALAPACAAAAALLLYSATPPHVPAPEADLIRDASLVRRTPLSFVSRAGATLIGLAAIGQAAFLLFTGVTSSRDESGRYRVIEFSTADAAASSGPYPGWFYALPLLAVTGILVAATVLALWRISSTPALGTRALIEVDDGWRRASNRIVVAVSGSALLLQFGGVALQAGLAIRRASVEGLSGQWGAFGAVAAAAGGIMLIGSVVAVTRSLLIALALPEISLSAVGPGGSRTTATPWDGVRQ